MGEETLAERLNIAVITDPRGDLDFLKKAILKLPYDEFKASEKSESPVKTKNLDAIFVIGSLAQSVFGKEDTELLTTARSTFGDALERDKASYNSIGIEDLAGLVHHLSHNAKFPRAFEQETLIPTFKRLIGFKKGKQWFGWGEAREQMLKQYAEIKAIAEKSKIPVYLAADSLFFHQLIKKKDVEECLIPEKFWLHWTKLTLGQPQEKQRLIKAVGTTGIDSLVPEYNVHPNVRGTSTIALNDFEPFQADVVITYGLDKQLHEQLKTVQRKIVIAGKLGLFEETTPPMMPGDVRIDKPETRYPGNLFFIEDEGVVSFYSLRKDDGVRVRYKYEDARFKRAVEAPIDLKEMHAAAGVVKRRRSHADAGAEMIDMASLLERVPQLVEKENPELAKKMREIGADKATRIAGYICFLESQRQGAELRARDLTVHLDALKGTFIEPFGLTDWFKKERDRAYQDLGATTDGLLAHQADMVLTGRVVERIKQEFSRTTHELNAFYSHQADLLNALEAPGVMAEEIAKRRKERGLAGDQELTREDKVAVQAHAAKRIEDIATIIRQERFHVDRQLKQQQEANAKLNEDHQKNAQENAALAEEKTKLTESISMLRENLARQLIGQLTPVYHFYTTLPEGPQKPLATQFIKRLEAIVGGDVIQSITLLKDKKPEELHLEQPLIDALLTKYGPLNTFVQEEVTKFGNQLVSSYKANEAREQHQVKQQKQWAEEHQKIDDEKKELENQLVVMKGVKAKLEQDAEDLEQQRDHFTKRYQNERKRARTLVAAARAACAARDAAQELAKQREDAVEDANKSRQEIEDGLKPILELNKKSFAVFERVSRQLQEFYGDRIRPDPRAPEVSVIARAAELIAQDAQRIRNYADLEQNVNDLRRQLETRERAHQEAEAWTKHGLREENHKSITKLGLEYDQKREQQRKEYESQLHAKDAELQQTLQHVRELEARLMLPNPMHECEDTAAYTTLQKALAEKESHASKLEEDLAEALLKIEELAKKSAMPALSDDAAKAEHDQLVKDYSALQQRYDELALRMAHAGYDLVERGKYLPGVAVYTAALTHAPQDNKPLIAKLHHNRGLAYAKGGKYAEATTDFAEALKLEPDKETEECLHLAHEEAGKRKKQ